MKLVKARLLMPIMALAFVTACSSMWKPSDSEAVLLVESYYLYARVGKAVDAEIVWRGEFDRECKCFPLTFKVKGKDQESFEKTFYFFKNSAGDLAVREYQYGLNP